MSNRRIVIDDGFDSNAHVNGDIGRCSTFQRAVKLPDEYGASTTTLPC